MPAALDGPGMLAARKVTRLPHTMVCRRGVCRGGRSREQATVSMHIPHRKGICNQTPRFLETAVFTGGGKASRGMVQHWQETPFARAHRPHIIITIIIITIASIKMLS